MKKFHAKTAHGTILFPGVDVMLPDFGPTGDENVQNAGFKNPLEATLKRVGEELAQLPVIADAPARAHSVRAMPAAVDLGTIDDAIKRPSGDYYLPRTVRAGDSTFPDVMMVRKAYEEKIPALLYGPPGTGKTALCEAALEGLITISGSGDTEVSDFIGGYVQNPDGTFVWVDGPLLVAMTEGRPLLIDEVALIDPRVMAVVYSAMDGRGEIVVTANPARGTVKAAEGFYVVGACNPDVPGAVMSEALTSRFLLQIEVLTDFDLAAKLGVPREIIVVAKHLTRKQTASTVIRAPQMRELLGFKKISDAFGSDAAIANFIGAAEPGDRDEYIESVKSAFGREVKNLVIA